MSPDRKLRYETVRDSIAEEIVPRGALSPIASLPPVLPIDDKPESPTFLVNQTEEEGWLNSDTSKDDKPKTLSNLVHQTIEKGWLFTDTSEMMRAVMKSAHAVVTCEATPGPVWCAALENFVRMIRISADVLSPRRSGSADQQINVSNNLILDSLRETRL